jgi:hypothetical protein
MSRFLDAASFSLSCRFRVGCGTLLSVWDQSGLINSSVSCSVPGYHFSYAILVRSLSAKYQLLKHLTIDMMIFASEHLCRRDTVFVVISLEAASS